MAASSLFSTDRSPRAVGGEVGRVVLFAAVLAGLSYVWFPYPLSPGIPIDFQVLGVFLAVLLLGPVRGTAAVVLFLIVGVAGLPVFDAGTGLDNLFSSPMVGYYLTYPVGAAVVGLLVHNGTARHDLETVRVRRLFGAMLAGLVVIYIGFTVGYAATMDTSLTTAVLIAAVPFFLAELVKIAAVIGIVRPDLLAGD